MITHTVLMRFADPADAETGRRLLEGLAAEIEDIVSMSVALDHSLGDVPPCELPRHHLRMTTTHVCAEALRAYQAHPAHLRAAAWLHPRLVARAVVDED